MAYSLHVILERYNKKTATGLSSRSVLERMSEIQMLDVVIPVTDGREPRMKRYTKPEKSHHLLLNSLASPFQPSHCIKVTIKVADSRSVRHASRCQ